MGSEAVCTLHHAGAVHTGTAQLETTFILFRGPVRLKIPFASATGATLEAGKLRVEHDGAATLFDLGRWLDKMLHPKSAFDKLGLKPGQRVRVLAPALPGFAEEVRDRGGASPASPTEDCDVIFLGAQTDADLVELPPLRGTIQQSGSVWVIYPKGVKAITELSVLQAGRAAGFTDVKVVSFSETHTALRFVIPKAARTPVKATRAAASSLSLLRADEKVAFAVRRLDSLRRTRLRNLVRF